MIVSEAQKRIQVPLAARDLSKERTASPDKLVRQTRLAPALCTKFIRKDFDRFVNPMVPFVSTQLTTQ
jgi:hypothetical protein